MTSDTKKVRVNSWQVRARKGGIYLAVVASLAGTQMACGGGSSEPEWETVTEQVPSKGVIQTIEEISDGKYAIIDEQTISNPADSRIIIKRLNGTVDSMTLDAAKSLVTAQDTVIERVTNNHYHSGGMGLGSVIWWGAMGYMMGRSFSTPVQPSVYRQYPNTTRQEERRDYRPTTSGSSSSGGTYNGYANGSKAADEIRSTSSTRSVQRPVSGKSGYFGSSSRSSSGS